MKKTLLAIIAFSVAAVSMPYGWTTQPVAFSKQAIKALAKKIISRTII